MDNVRDDLKEKTIDLTRIGEATRNREVWRTLLRASSSADGGEKRKCLGLCNIEKKSLASTMFASSETVGKDSPRYILGAWLFL